MTGPTVVAETYRGIIGLLVPRGRRLHPILRLDYFVRISTYPLFFILLVATLYPDRLTAFFWALNWVVGRAMAGHVLATAELMGTYQLERNRR